MELCLSVAACDQVCIFIIARPQILKLRRKVIEFAHENRPEAPSFDIAEEFMGDREAASGTLIDQRRIARMAAMQVARVKIMEREERTLARVSGPHNDGDAGGGPKTRPKGGGKGCSATAKQ